VRIQKFYVAIEQPGPAITAAAIHRCLLRGEMSSASNVTVTEIDESDELQVGDRVRTLEGHSGSISGVENLYCVAYDDGIKGDPCWHNHQLTKLPPKPTYTVDAKADTLRLLKDGNVFETINMEDPEKVETAIESWSDRYGIDADEVQELVAEPRKLDNYMAANNVIFNAVRHANGWQVKCCGLTLGQCSFLGDGHIQPEHIAKAMFPKINGPYLEKP
jgi:hypothetical protein